MNTERFDIDVQERTVHGGDRALCCHLNGARHDVLDTGNDGAWLTSRHQRAIGPIRTIGEALRQHAQTQRTSSGRERRPRQRVEDQLGVCRKHGSRDGFGQFPVTSCHVVERAVRLRMRHPYAFGPRHAGDCSKLVENEVFRLLRRQDHVAASESGQVWERRVCSDGHAQIARHSNCGAQHRWIARVKACRNICRCHASHERAIVAERVGAKRLADVGVQIHSHRD